MFSIHTDDECFYVGIEQGNDNSKKNLKSHIEPYQCCPTTKEKAQARVAVLSDTKLGSSKEKNNDITFKFENVKDQKSVGKPKGSKLKAPPKPAQSQDERKPKESKKEPSPEKKKRERDVKEKEPKDSTKDKDIDKKDKKGKEKKEKGKNKHDDDGDGFFQLGNWW